MTRASIALLTLALLGATAHADFLILKRGGKLQVWGMPATVGKGNNRRVRVCTRCLRSGKVVKPARTTRKTAATA